MLLEPEDFIEAIKGLCKFTLKGEVEEKKENGVYVVTCKLPSPTLLETYAGSNGIIFGLPFPHDRVRMLSWRLNKIYVESSKPSERYDLRIDLSYDAVSYNTRGVYKSFTVSYNPKEKSMTIKLE